MRRCALSIAFILIPEVIGAQVRDALSIQDTAAGVTQIPVMWGSSFGNPVTFVGDVDGDRFGDLLMRVPDPHNGASPETLLIFFGSVIEPGTASLDSFRSSSLHHGSIGTGIYPRSRSPYAAAGDVDGDGFDDFLLGSHATDWNGVKDSGLAMLVFGAAKFPAAADLEDLGAAGIRTVRFISSEAGASTGWAVAGAGDMNGDGKLDIAITSLNAPGTVDGEPGGGRVHVVFGPFQPGTDIRLADVGGTVPGFVIDGASGQDNASLGDWLGYSLAGGLDVNGDDFSDLIIGARGVTADRGAVYLVFGGPAIPTRILAAAPGTWGSVLRGPQGDRGNFGESVAAVGDADGDGLDDFAAGAPQGSSGGPGATGRAFLIFGDEHWEPEGFIDSPEIRSLRIDGTRPEFVYPYGELGLVVAPAGDWNRDGLADLLVTAYRQADGFAERAGRAYIVFGGGNLPAAAADTAIGTAALPGLLISGADSFTHLGSQVASGGDLDGDGRLDLVLTAPFQVPHLPPEPSRLVFIRGGAGFGESLRLSSVEPDFGDIRGGLEVRIAGAGFSGGEEVRIGGAPASRVQVAASNLLIARTPAQAGAGRVDVEVRRGQAAAILPGGFEYFPVPAHPDLLLDEAALETGPGRALIFSDFEVSGGLVALAAGDLDGDDFDDLVLGMVGEGPDSQGRVAIIFGGGGLPRAIRPGETGLFGTVIDGDPNSFAFGISLALPGDLDGDGHPDLVIAGAIDKQAVDPNSPSGATFVLLGRQDWPPLLEISAELAAGRALVIPNRRCGHAWAAAPGNLDGDGRPDLLLGSNQCAGADAQVRLFGAGLDLPPPPPTALISGDPTPVVPPIPGEVTPRMFGTAVSGAGDLNGDGRLDFIVGADHLIGEAYLVLTPAGGFPAQVSIADLVAGGRAVRISRQAMLGELGTAAAGAGDFNGDGLADAAIGVPGGGRSFHGEVYVLMGSRELGLETREIDLLAPGGSRLVLRGESPYDFSGRSVAGLGDLNGDDLGDIGILGDDLFDHRARAYVVFGMSAPPEEIPLDRLAFGERGYRLLGTEGSKFFAVPGGGMAAGDFDGDGLRDLVVALSTPAGKRVMVLFGRRMGEPIFARGDANRDGSVDLSDAVASLEFQFIGGAAPRCLDALDVDDNGIIEITDPIALLGFLFLGDPPPPPPYPAPGLDPTPDVLGCLE